MPDGEHSERVAAVSSWILCVLIVALFVAVGVPVYRLSLQRTDARLTAAQSRTVELAVVTVSAECRQYGAAFADQSSPTGFAPGVEERIRSLSACEGQVILLQWDEDAYCVRRMLYTEGNCASLYHQNADGRGVWETYHFEPVFLAED